MVKVFVYILFTLFIFVFPDQVQARSLPDKEHIKHLLLQAQDNVFTTLIEYPAGIEQVTFRSIPASRCGHALKELGSNASNLQSSITAEQGTALKYNNHYVVGKSSYLLHIYPSHNFW